MAKDDAYRNAEKKIAAARKSGAKELDLSVPWDDEKTPKLTELPESLGQLMQLQTLDLTNNQLTVLPKWLSQFAELQMLTPNERRLTRSRE